MPSPQAYCLNFGVIKNAAHKLLLAELVSRMHDGLRPRSDSVTSLPALHFCGRKGPPASITDETADEPLTRGYSKCSVREKQAN
jgi:hypothetical protein